MQDLRPFAIRALRLAAGALAASAGLAAAPARAGDWGGLFSAIILTSDYRYQGVSSTDKRPALQAYVHWWRPDGWYVGGFVSQVHYYDGGPHYEVDAYAGKHLDLKDGKTQLTAEAMYTSFPDNKTPGPTFDFLQLKLAAQRREGPFTLKGSTSFVPQASYGSGQAWLVEGETDYVVNPRITLKALAGHRWIERGVDRDYWSLGPVFSFGQTPTGPRYVVEVRYQATSLDKAHCGFNPEICGPAVVGSLTVSLPPIL